MSTCKSIQNHTSSSASDTERIAEDFANILTVPECIALYGDLGTGKSVFARALIRTLMQEPDLDVPSPTFTLVQSYETEKGLIHHFDLYRIRDPEELQELGWEEALHNIMLVEWPEKAGFYLPEDRINITIEYSNDSPDKRNITIAHAQN